MIRWSVFALSLSVLVIWSCARSAGEGAAVERPSVAVEVAQVVPGEIKESIAVVGTLDPKYSGEVKTEYSGTVTDVYVTEWVHVTKGTLLARFDRREPEAIVKAARAARLQAEVGANRAHRELERAMKLKGAGLATQQNLDDARTVMEAADAQLNAAKAQEEMAQTRLLKTEVRAPFDGVISARIVNPGSYIQNMGSESTMFRIVDNRRLELTMSVPSSQISSIRLGQPVTFTTDAVPGRTFEGRVSYINPAADETSRGVKVVALVENRDSSLKAGLFAKGAIITGERRGVLSIPRTAMLTWDPGHRAALVYVVQDDRAVRRNITTGAATGEAIEVATGLASGETVITRGAFNVRAGDKVTIVKPVAEGVRGFEGSDFRGNISNRDACDHLTSRNPETPKPRNLVG